MENNRDLSGAYVNKSQVLQKAENPLPYNEFLHHSRARDKHAEFLVLKKITETSEHQQFLENNLNYCLLNRYNDILPYKDTIVPLSSGEYINASYILSAPNYKNQIIACQAPLSNTSHSFWSMIWEQNVYLIVMCCELIENDMPKCFEYFPVDQAKTFEQFEVTLEREKQKFVNIVKRTFLFSNGEGIRKITHLSINGWEDNSVLNVRESFSALNYVIFMIQHKIKKHSGRAVVHCSAGVGRTGVLLGIYEMVMQLEEEDEQVTSISVFKTVRKLREQRWGMVSNEDQYRFMYSFMEYWISTFLL